MTEDIIKQDIEDVEVVYDFLINKFTDPKMNFDERNVAAHRIIDTLLNTLCTFVHNVSIDKEMSGSMLKDIGRQMICKVELDEIMKVKVKRKDNKQLT
jgi:hypothetical protein